MLKNNNSNSIQNENIQVDHTVLPSELFKKHLEEELAESYKEIIGDSEEEFIKRLGENIKYLKLIEKTNYRFTAKDGFKCKDLVNEKISNAFIFPLKEQYLIDIDSIKSNLEIMALISPTGEVLPPITRSIEDIENGKWMTDPIWWKKIINEIPFQKNIQVNCIKELTKFIPVETVYLFTGFTSINNKKVYLHTGGAIGTDEPIKVDLGDAELNRLYLTKRELNLKECCPLKFLEVVSKKTGVFLLALVYKAVLSSIFEELGIIANFLTVVSGSKDAEKLNMVLAPCNSFGNYDAGHIPIKLTDSESEIKEKITKCRDMLLPCTGYLASSNRAESNQISKNFETLIKTNRIDGAKATIIVAADIVPEVFESYRSNVLMINVQDEDINKKELNQLLEHQEKWQYFMKRFLENLCVNYDEIKVEIQEIFKNKVTEFKKDLQPEIAEAVAELYVGYLMLINFALKNEIITLDVKEKMLKEAWDILLQIAKEQEAVIEETSPRKMTEETIEILDSMGKITTFDLICAEACSKKEIEADGFIRIL